MTLVLTELRRSAALILTSLSFATPHWGRALSVKWRPVGLTHIPGKLVTKQSLRLSHGFVLLLDVF